MSYDIQVNENFLAEFRKGKISYQDFLVARSRYNSVKAITEVAYKDVCRNYLENILKECGFDNDAVVFHKVSKKYGVLRVQPKVYSKVPDLSYWFEFFQVDSDWKPTRRLVGVEEFRLPNITSLETIGDYIKNNFEKVPED